MGLLEPKDLESWALAVREHLDIVDGLVWARIDAGHFTGPEELRNLAAAHRHVEQSKESLLKAQEAAVQGPPPKAEEAPTSEPRRTNFGGRGDPRTCKHTMTNAREDGSRVCVACGEILR